MLKQLADGLWIADMEVQRAGFRFDARTTLIRFADGRLWVHSPVELRAELKEWVQNAGDVGWIVAPSGLHYAHVRDWADAFPAAKVYAAPGAVKRLKAVRVDDVLGEAPPEEWDDVLEQAAVGGSSLYDEIDFLHKPTRTLILTDLCFNIPVDRSLMTRLMAGMLGVLGRFNYSKTFKLTLKDREAARGTLERILSWDFDRVIISHGDILETGGKEAVRRSFAWLLE
jgi:hypothetical protein